MSLRSSLRSLSPFALALAAMLPHCTAAQAPAEAHRFAGAGDHFELDGKPLLVLSGEIHYARVPREYWRQRIRMARAMGLNTIATYVFWNVHEPKPGVYDFSGNNDLVAFIKTVQEEHMHVLLRAGPYSCAEWEFGGFPAWLLADPKMATALRTNDPAFTAPVERWMKRLAKEVGPLQVGLGGPILAVQIENEYGNFSNDPSYMKHMRDVFVAAGFTHALLYTVDPSKALAKGEIDGVYSGVNFGTGRAAEALDILAKQRPGQPLFATEYWPGWFDLWGHPHETRPVAPQVEDIDTMMRRGASMNIYMVHGGTSFGMMAGASESTGAYRGNVTSYDYDAPVDEAGHATKKFFAYRDTILKYTHEKPLPVPEAPPVIAVAPFRLTHSTSLWEHLPKPIHSDLPKTMEQVGQSYGYILYRKQIVLQPGANVLKLDHLQDFALVYLDGKLMGPLDRHFHEDTIKLFASGKAQLDILVENTGRLNSTKKMRDETKGIHDASINDLPLRGWEILSLPMSTEPLVSEGSHVAVSLTPTPHFAKGSFTLDKVGDTFLDVRALGKGVIWINGHPLGRFWDIGPQGTLYVPGPWLKQGRNEVTIFELLKNDAAPALAGLTTPILDAPTPGYDSDPELNHKPGEEFVPAPLESPATSPANKPAATSPHTLGSIGGK
ncbi:beta-galactosidase [Bryocella elongata]|uniref:Beta-galactosidase n=1 Tax=Bryocella elongata TaxID=863522 RepID=A0A1H5VYE8_9BACT|nr:beta-galactosidase family protein [Bryocella elongata]SEF92292.1 beta-galactosidase [Bryocella elongata]